jgi:uroporphyrinogen decarboxylase
MIRKHGTEYKEDRMGEASVRSLLLRVFNQEQVDRIPVSPFIHVNHVKEFFRSHDVDWVARTPEVYAHYGFDCIHRNCSPAYDAFGPSGPEWAVESRLSRSGRDETTTTLVVTPGGELRYMEQLRWVYEYDAESSVTEYPIRSKADFELLRRYLPPLGPVDASDIRRAKAAVGDNGVIAPWMQGAFNLVAVYYRKVDDLLLDPLIDPEFFHQLMSFCLARYKSFIQQIIDAGVDVLSCGGNIANGKMVSRDYFRQHILPYEQDLVRFIQGQGVAVLYHNCGYARNLIPLYPELGAKAYESLTPPPYGDTILEEAVASFGTGTTMLGGIDQLDLLRKGTAEEIESAVRRVMDTVRGRCSFVLGTTDYFNENTPADKIRLLAEAGRRHGRL